MTKIYKGIPYTGTLPAVLAGTKAGNLHRYKIYGNMEQTDVPTPENPIAPQECGERTENLFNISMVEQGGYNAIAGTTPSKNVSSTRCRYSEIIPLLAPTLSLYCSPNAKINYVWVDANGKSLGGSGFQKSGDTATAPEQAVSMTFILGLDGDVQCTPSNFYGINIVSGSTAPESYIPFGYKLPLLSGSTPVDIYLGESQTTRRIRKLVLTGEENWLRQSSQHTTCINLYMVVSDSMTGDMIISNVATYSSAAGQYNDSLVNVGRIAANGVNLLMDMDLSDFATLTAWKEYLAQQYANGTPVTVCYVLATPTTGTLNEPLRKIGDYADTIDSTQTTAQIPISANSTTISWAGEGLAPSEFDSIAEWVSAVPKIYTNGVWEDAQTYTYTNGEWVADTQ